MSSNGCNTLAVELKLAREEQRLDARKKRNLAKRAREEKRETAIKARDGPRCAPTGLSLRPYQEATVAKAVATDSKHWRRLLVLATGAGKTVIAAEILNRILEKGGRALFVAHRDELILQGKAEMEGFVPDFQVHVEQAHIKAPRSRAACNPEMRHVVIGSILSMQGARLASWPRDAFDIVVIDEAHHGPAKSYMNIVEHFGCMDTEIRTPLIGVTATPERSDKIGLKVLFQEIAAEYNIRALIDEGYLCDIRAIAVETETDIRQVKKRGGDYVQRDLEEAVADDVRNGLILAAYQEHALGRPAIVFAAGVAHAQDLAGMFKQNGVPAHAVWGDMGRELRHDVLNRYARGEIRVLTHFNVLTEGFNAPQTSCIILARPTTSNLIITQSIGRGTRLHQGKENCLVIDVVDITDGKDLFTAASLAGLPPGFDAKGEDLMDCADEWGELKELDPRVARHALDPVTVRKWLEEIRKRLKAREVNILNRPMEAAEKKNPVVIPDYVPGQPYKSPFAWHRVGDSYEIALFNREFVYGIHGAPGDWFVDAQGVDECAKYLGWDRESLMANAENAGTFEDLHEAAHAADALIAAHHVNTRIIERNAPWREDGATEKQLALLRKLRQPIPDGLTKGAAIVMIDAALSRFNSHPKKQMAFAS